VEGHITIDPVCFGTVELLLMYFGLLKVKVEATRLKADFSKEGPTGRSSPIFA